MEDRPEYFPFDSSWRMRIDLPYSLYVRDRDVLWSCGQCPLNGSGDVLHPDDLFAQAHAVANLIHQFLQSIGSDRSSLAQLAVYYVKTADGDSDRLRKFFRETFNPNMIVIPISIPHFYYDGMMIEVDVFGSRTSKKFSRVVDKATAAELEVADVGELRFASLTAPPGINFDGVPGRLFEQSGLAMEQLLSAQWLVASASGYKQLESSKANETTNSWQVASIIPDGFEIVGQLIFGPRRATVPEVRTKLLTYEEESVQIRRSESYHEDNATIASTLEDRGLSFADVRKATTLYVAGGSAEELHDNMMVRNSYFRKPGPASTGLPIRGFLHDSSLISVRFFGIMPAETSQRTVKT